MTAKMIDMPSGARDIIDALMSRGFEAYAVGGCVRDSLMGRVPHDWDVCTSARPCDVRDALGARYPIIPTGEKYGTLTVSADGETFEVTTFRGDGAYSDGRRPDSVTFSDNLADDLSRRDFTMNAVAYNPRLGLADPFGGAEDIRRRVIRTVGAPRARLAEDALRIMRACRFASELGFSLDPDTAAAVKALAPTLANVAAERISAELIKLLMGSHVEHVLNAHREVLFAAVPPLAALDCLEQNRHHFLDAYRHTARVVAASPPVPEVRMAALLHDVGKAACRTVGADGDVHFYGHAEISAETADALFAKELRFSGDFRKRVLLLIRHHNAEIAETGANVKRWLARLGEPAFRQLLDLNAADAAGHADMARERREAKTERLRLLLDVVIASKDCFSLQSLDINGHDLIAAGHEPGPQMGRLLRALLSAVIDGKCDNEKSALLRYSTQI
ncbi:MAG: HD domain-containing protein [Oscillospiraceae bacterium]|jgi:tRNA nucleotidyltransferase (CCA-adding enzyme)|nr:HD domain-containing protein [Oscillospiraceae bacterium]